MDRFTLYRNNGTCMLFMYVLAMVGRGDGHLKKLTKTESHLDARYILVDEPHRHGLAEQKFILWAFNWIRYTKICVLHSK